MRMPRRRTRVGRSWRASRSRSDPDLDLHAALRAQRLIGNGNVARLLQANQAERGAGLATPWLAGLARGANLTPLAAPQIQRDTPARQASSGYRQRVIQAKQYKMYLRDITHFHPDARFMGAVRKKWLPILSAYCAGYLTDTKYITIDDMKYDTESDFDVTIKNMLDVTWQSGDDPTILADKLNRLDSALNRAKRLMTKMTKPSGFVGKRWVREFHKRRHGVSGSFMSAGSWTHVFSWRTWLGL